MNKIYALTHKYEREEQECGTSVHTEHLCFYKTKEEGEAHLEILKTSLGAHRDYKNWRIKSKGQWNQHIFKCSRYFLPYEQREFQGPITLEAFKEVEYHESEVTPTVNNCVTLFGSFTRKDIDGNRSMYGNMTSEEEMPAETITLYTYEDFYQPTSMKGELVYIEEIPLFKPLKKEVKS